jgi:hypothetical protein
VIINNVTLLPEINRKDTAERKSESERAAGVRKKLGDAALTDLCQHLSDITNIDITDIDIL